MRKEEGRESLPVAEVTAYDYKCVLSCEIRGEQLAVFTLLVFANSTYQDRDNFDVCIWIYQINRYY